MDHHPWWCVCYDAHSTVHTWKVDLGEEESFASHPSVVQCMASGDGGGSGSGGRNSTSRMQTRNIGANNGKIVSGTPSSMTTSTMDIW